MRNLDVRRRDPDEFLTPGPLAVGDFAIHQGRLSDLEGGTAGTERHRTCRDAHGFGSSELYGGADSTVRPPVCGRPEARSRWKSRRLRRRIVSNTTAGMPISNKTGARASSTADSPIEVIAVAGRSRGPRRDGGGYGRRRHRYGNMTHERVRRPGGRQHTVPEGRRIRGGDHRDRSARKASPVLCFVWSGGPSNAAPVPDSGSFVGRSVIDQRCCPGVPQRGRRARPPGMTVEAARRSEPADSNGPPGSSGR